MLKNNGQKYKYLLYRSLQVKIKQMNINYDKGTIRGLPDINHSDQKYNNSQEKQKDKKVFLTKAERFNHQFIQTPGPGTYQSLIKDKHTTDYRVAAKAKDDRGIAQEHQWILGSGRLQNSINLTSNNIGPGMYNEVGTHSNNFHSNWSKGSRFDSSNFVNTALGPGIYNPETIKSSRKQRNNELAVFKSKSPKTFFQQMIEKQRRSKTKNPQQSIQYQNQQIRRVVIKFDETQYPIKKIVHKLSPVFNSKSKRPDLLVHQSSSQQIGPGSYSQSLEFTEKSHSLITKYKGISSAIHYHLNSQQIAKGKTKLQSKALPPGPGTYNIQSKLSESKSKKGLIGIISKDQRFKYKKNHSKEKSPGPGQYMKNRFTMIKQQQIQTLKQKISFGRKPEKIHDFGTAARSSLRSHNNVPFGQYNVHNFDLQYKIMKQKEHLQKLRLMQVTLPAFNTKNKNKN